MTFFSTMLNKFPPVEDNKIDTKKFLLAAEEVVRLVEQLGKVFAPVKMDMKNNIEKLHGVYKQNEINYRYIQDMLLLERAKNEDIAIISLQWLRRGLHLFLHMFECVVTDYKSGKRSENFSEFLKEAYIETLEPYHGWVTQKLFQVFYRMCPSRNQFFSYLSNNNDNSINEDVIVSDMLEFNTSLRNCISNLITFYRENNLEDTNRV